MSVLRIAVSILVVGWGLIAGLHAAQADQEGLIMAAKATSIYDFTMDDIDGKPVNLGQYQGKGLVNEYVRTWARETYGDVAAHGISTVVADARSKIEEAGRRGSEAALDAAREQTDRPETFHGFNASRPRRCPPGDRRARDASG